VATYLGKLLLIEKDFEVRMSIAEELRELRWLVETAASGQMGMEAATKGQPNVVITSLDLPDMPSVNFARSLRTFIEHDAFIVGITDALDRVTPEVRAGFDEVVATPVDVSELHTRLLRLAPKGVEAFESERITTEMVRGRR
jgi:DNA-binding response OmpR family regulator